MSDSRLDLLFEFLRFPSVSTDPARRTAVAGCADWLVAKLGEFGLNAELHPTDGHPIVIARNEHHAGRRTVLIYGHYDVQPEDPVAEWKSDPFTPLVRDGIIYAR